ncbi:MAG: putative DNA-binding protein (MmcQ/YjbR family) [Lentimonas sp.]|jgi:predicted DNA-binding protein (MmcQ/YjbR family)
MHLEELRDYCLSKDETTESLPFGPDTLVFKVANKMFALTGLKSFESVNLKCDPERAIQLRESNSDVVPGYHMSKAHWNTVRVNQTLTDIEVKELIDHSYDLIVSGLPIKDRERFENR